jgi:K+-sensing histidine kinase KdpD
VSFETMILRRRHRRAADPDLLRLRDDNAWRYLMVLRPAVVALGLVIAVVSMQLAPSESVRSDLLLVACSTVVTIVAIIAARRVRILHVVNATIVLDIVVLYQFIIWSEQPQITVIVLIWPIIALSYFASPASSMTTATFVSASCFWLQANDPHWSDDRGVPGAAYIIFISGLLIWFAAREGRRIEQALARDRTRSERALALAERIRLSADPHASLEEIARVVGSETGADRCVAALYGTHDDHLADVADWSSGPTDRAPLDRTDLDPTILHLASSGAGLVTDADRVLVRTGSATRSGADVADEGAAAEALRATVGIDVTTSSCVLCPLLVGDRAVGFLLVASRRTTGWSEATAQLLSSLAPQLAAGLAQVVIVRDQREAIAASERLDEMRDRLIASVSHELRTPLTSTIGFVETLLRDDVELSPQDRVLLLRHARDGGQRLLSLVEDLLTLGTTRPESLDLQREPMLVRDLLDAAVIGIDVPPGRSLEVDVRSECAVIVDRHRMLQVLANLVVNAIRHGAGTVAVVGTCEGDQVIIDVMDEGPGVADQHVRELFLPFATFSSRTDSTGLGLAICRTITEAHGGSIGYERIEGGRTRFRVRLPLAKPVAADAATGQPTR